MHLLGLVYVQGQCHRHLFTVKVSLTCSTIIRNDYTKAPHCVEGYSVSWFKLLIHLLYSAKEEGGGARGKESTCQGRRHKRYRFNPWVGKIPWKKAWQPTAIFFPGEPMDRGDWRATVQRAAKTQTRLNWFSTAWGHSFEREKQMEMKDSRWAMKVKANKCLRSNELEVQWTTDRLLGSGNKLPDVSQGNLLKGKEFQEWPHKAVLNLKSRLSLQ